MDFTQDEFDRTANPKCAITFTLGLIGGKWKLPIIWALSEHESLRYNELKRQVEGVTNIMLTRCLNELAEFGIVARNERKQIPPHVDYCLTALGRELIPALSLINQWGEAWRRDAEARGFEPREKAKD